MIGAFALGLAFGAEVGVVEAQDGALVVWSGEAGVRVYRAVGDEGRALHPQAQGLVHEREPPPLIPLA